MKEYDELLEKLRNVTSETGNEQEVINNVMRVIRKPEHLAFTDVFFGWTDSLWLRRTMATIAVCIVFFFIVQQSMIINKIGMLEERVVEVSTQSILDQQKENVLARSVILRIPDDGESLKDSLKVASKDLTDLIRSYRELQYEYERLKEELKSKEDIIN